MVYLVTLQLQLIGDHMWASCSSGKTPKTRNTMLCIADHGIISPNVAPPLGPILGGVLASSLGWHWIFWFLCIVGSACLLMILFTLPETARCLVGNGSIPAHGINRTFLSFISEWRKPRSESQSRGQRPKLSLPNPLASLKLLLVKDVAIVLVCNGIYYMIYCCAQASLSSLFIEVYHYGELASGLVYIPFGVACLISLLVWGKVLDHDYARLSKSLATRSAADLGDGVDEFPIERARLRTALYLVGLNTLATIGYGWSVAYRAVGSSHHPWSCSSLLKMMHTACGGTVDTAISHWVFHYWTVFSKPPGPSLRD